MGNKTSKTKNYATMFIVVRFSFAAQTNFDRKIYKKQSKWKGDSTLLPQSKRVFDPKSFFVQLFHFIYLFFLGVEGNWNIRLCHAV